MIYTIAGLALITLAGVLLVFGEEETGTVRIFGESFGSLLFKRVLFYYYGNRRTAVIRKAL